MVPYRSEMGLVLEEGIQRNQSSSELMIAGSLFPLGRGFHPVQTNTTIVLLPLKITSHCGICLTLSQIHQNIYLLWLTDEQVFLAWQSWGPYAKSQSSATPLPTAALREEFSGSALRL